MITRTTHTLANLPLSPAAYKEIESALREAGYGHAFVNEGRIDMTGIAVTEDRKLKAAPLPPKPAPRDAMLSVISMSVYLLSMVIFWLTVFRFRDLILPPTWYDPSGTRAVWPFGLMTMLSGSWLMIRERRERRRAMRRPE